MDALYNFTAYPATVKFSTIKHCFLIVPSKWTKDLHGELLIFKILYGENKEKEAYMSCGKDVSRQSDLESKVFMNQKFAEMLGLKEKETVLLQHITVNIPKAVKIIVEPLTSDDWEIIEKNAQSIESGLMNQIRIVWTGQIFPVWVQNYCFCKVVSCEPNHNPVILYENSEVNIVPKDRYNSSAYFQRIGDSTKKRSNYLQFQFLRNYLKPELSSEMTDSDETTNLNQTNSEIVLPQSIAAIANNFLASWFSSSKDEKLLEQPEELESFTEIYEFNFDSVLRVLPYKNPKTDISSVVQATTVFITESTYIACCGDKEIPPCFIGVLEKYVLPGKKSKKGTNDNIKSNQSDSTVSKNNDKIISDNVGRQRIFDSICVTVIVIKSADDEYKLPFSLYTYKNAIVVPKELKRALSLEVGCLVHLKSIHAKPLSSYILVFHPVTTLNPNITEKVIQEHFTMWAFGKHRKHYTFVISDGTLVKLKIHSRKCEFFIHLQEKENSVKSIVPESSLYSLDAEKSISLKNESDYGLLTYKSMKNTVVKIGAEMCVTVYDERPFLIKDNGMYCEVKASKLSELGGLNELSTKAIEDIEFWLKLRPSSYISYHPSTYYGCMLICGPKGVGKSAFANALCKKFSSYPYHALIRSVHCLSLKGKRVETIAKKWDEIVSEAIYGQPSLILFEDLDYIASSPLSYEQENGPDGVYFSSISQAFISMMHRITSSEGKVVVIATSQSRHSLHPSLVNTKGRHIFQSILEVNPPNAEQRADILHALLCNKHHISHNTQKKVKISEIAAKTEGYVAQDLSILVDKATHAAWVRLASYHDDDQITLQNKDFYVAMKEMVPSSLRGISLQMEEKRTWKDVGGLSKVKKIIQQIILWPSKYKEIYKNYSLKPQTNILLYGAPGTGKTLLASVVANECGLNFISIKGPELLSKYIGASEQAVRDLFKRAATAKPCILFFDEFDSIAPRRGHDSTGVTDRVVNQLLTQLDGVESLEGVHVLAATSRPELIDPALLRPGRLDKCLLCPLPDKEERVEILHCLSSKLPLCDDIDFQGIASLTEHFSGADLQALLYTAHIDALHDIQYSSTKHYTTSLEDSDYCRASAKYLYMPIFEEGLKTLSYEDGKKLIQDVTVVHDKYFEGACSLRESRRHSTLHVSITQRHLLKVASEMKPSVSFEERLRYNMVFKDFQNALSGEAPASPRNVKRVTLA